MTKVEELRGKLPLWTEVERLRDKMFAGHTTTANVDALCAAVARQERERIYAYVNDSHNPHYVYRLVGGYFYLRAENLRKFIESGKEWVNEGHFTPEVKP